MLRQRLSRRPLPKASASAAVALTTPAAFSTRVLAQAPAAEPITPQLIAAARKEGKLSFYTAMDIPVAERLAKTFEARYSGLSVRVERSGSERIYQRIEQERGSRIFAVDVINSADAATSWFGSATTGWQPICPRRPRAISRPSIETRTPRT